MTATPWDWDFLIHRHLSGGLTEEQRTALNEALRGDPRLRRRLAELAFEQAQYRDLKPAAVPILILPEDAREPVAAPLLRPLPPQQKRRWFQPVVAAAAAVFAIIVTLVIWRSGGPEQPFTLVSGEVRSEGPKVDVSGTAPALFRMSDGSEAELSPASSAVFRGRVGDARQVVELSQGTGKFKVAKAPESFRIDTPSGRVSVLGTEFSVELRKTKKRPPLLAVSVASGRVRVEAGGITKELGPGQSHVFGAEPELKKEPRAPDFSGVLQGRVTAKGDAHILLSVDRVVRAAPGVGESALASRSVKVLAKGARRKDGEPQPEKVEFLFIRKLQIGQELTIDVRPLEGGDYMVGQLDPEQVEWALRREERKDENKKKIREPERSPDREEK